MPQEKYTSPLETQLGVELATLLFTAGYCETFKLNLKALKYGYL